MSSLPAGADTESILHFFYLRRVAHQSVSIPPGHGAPPFHVLCNTDNFFVCCDIFDGQEITIKKYMEERFFFVLDVIIMNNNTI